MKKKILSIALALCMVLTMMPMATGVAWADTATSVTVGGVQMVSEDATTYYKDGSVSTEEINGYTAKYEPNTGTLTLNGLNLTNGKIIATGDLTIVLVGENNIGNNTYDGNCIKVETGDLTISGAGTLEAYNGYNDATTIYASGSITIKDGAKVTATHASGGAQVINANGGNITISGTNTIVDARTGSYYALLAGNVRGTTTKLYDINVSDGATLIAEGSGQAVKGTVKIDNVVAGIANKDKVKVGTSASSNGTWDGNTTTNPLTGYKYLKIVSASSLSPVPETVPNANFTATGDTTGTLSDVESGMKYSTDGGNSWTDIESNTYVNLTGLSACTISVVKKGNGMTTSDSDAQSITVEKAVAPINVTTTDCTTSHNNDGKLQNVTNLMEYKKSDAGSWTDCGGTEVSSLANGTYYVRVKATGTVLASVYQEVQIAAYNVPATVATPVISPNGGTFTGTQTVTITCATDDAKIYYTTDGTDPTTSSTEYTGGFAVTASTTVKAIAVKDGMTNSVVTTATFTKSSGTSGTGGGGNYIPPVQKPVIGQNDNVKTELSSDGTKLTIKVADGYEIIDVLVNGVSKGKITEITGLKTGDKVEVKTEKKQEEPKEPTKEEIIAALDSSKLVARSKFITLKNGKKAVRITWYNKNGNEGDFDGVEIYRSTQRYKGYGLKPFYATKDGKTEGYYVNTKDLKEGTAYYYKVRGYIEIDGQKYYTDYSLKAIRTIK